MAIPNGVFQHAPVHKLVPNDWNYNHQDTATFNKLVASIKQNGFSQPVIARELPSGMLEIINGEHRWKAAKRLKLQEVPVFLLEDADDEKARTLTIALNELSGSPDEDKLAALMHQLSQSIDVKTLESVLPYDAPALQNYIQQGDTALRALQDMVDKGAESEAPPAPRERPAGQVKVLKFQLSPSIHAEMSTKIAEIARDPSKILVEAIRDLHEREMTSRALKKAKAKAAVKKLGVDKTIASKKKAVTKKKAPAKKRTIRRRPAAQA